MTFLSEALNDHPKAVRSIPLPHSPVFRTDEAGREIPYHPSPVAWAGEVLYFLLPDRFSDGLDHNRPAFDHTKPPSAARPAGFRWDKWAQSGGERWQGGTLQGIASHLDYLSHLGVTALWIGPIFKQRRHTDEYHGYAIQNFLEVDPHFGDRKDLVNLVGAAHQRGMRVILDVVFNHSGHNWDYAGNVENPSYRPWPAYYERGPWLNADGEHTAAIADDPEAGVWPQELQRDECYTRAGQGNLGGEDVDDDHAEIKRTDFAGAFRDFNFDDPDTLNDITRCFKYWIALTDIDGMRLDTLKHVPKDAARNFCGAIKEFAANLGKDNFFLVGEVAGSDASAGKYLDALELNLNAALDIGSSRVVLSGVAKGLEAPSDYFSVMQPWNPTLGSHRYSAQRHVKIVDDHDHVCGAKVRFSCDASNDHQVCAATAIQLLTLGIPCIYYGTEQGFAGPEKNERQYLPDYGNGADKYLRETMFGAPHPHKHGAQGVPPSGDGFDIDLPGFGAFGTAGCHFFNQEHPVYRRIHDLIAIRQSYPTLRYGRQYARPIRNFGAPFTIPGSGELIAWSRILDEEEMLCVVNGHGNEARGADILVDRALNATPGSSFTVVANSLQSVQGSAYQGAHPIGSKLAVQMDKASGCAFVEIRGLGPSEVLVLTDKPEPAQRLQASRPASRQTGAQRPMRKP
ncbi:MAG: amy [Rhodocyclaceae bacterium]|nr:amy [Rhodocyclaceae bacterium]